MLEVRHLRAFIAVADLGSVAAAARSLGYTQSAVSQQLQSLESIVGQQVLRRYAGGRRPAQLTPAGELMIGHARHLLARVQATAADLATVTDGRQRTVGVATIQSVGARVLPRALAAFRAGNPTVEVLIQELRNAESLQRAVERGAVDVALTALPVDESVLCVHHLLADPYVLIVPRGDLAGIQEADLTSAVQLTEILGGRRVLGIKSCADEERVSQQLLADDHFPVVERFDDNELIQQLVAAGEGVAIVPALTTRADDPRITVVPLAALPPRRLAAITHADRVLSATVRDFISAVQDASRLVPQFS
jgi:molybdate transport repressor ModE-like protein